MSRLIDADALIHELNNSHYPGAPYIDAGISIAIGKVCDAPTIEPERKTGKWIERNPQNSDKCRLIECNQCGFSHIVGFNVPYEHWIENRNFCERCGADMRGEHED